MKKQRLVIELLCTVLGIFLLTACGGSGEARIIDGVLEEIFNDFRAVEEYVVLDYLEYDRIIQDENKTYANDPRYANKTPDGKIDWSKAQEFEKRTDISPMFDKVTLNGEKVKLPMTFEELNEEFSDFNKIDLKNLKEENLTLAFRNIKNDYVLRFKNKATKGEDYHLASILKDNVRKMNVFISGSKNGYTIIGISTRISSIPGTYDLRVDGIGVGNTFNEMYKKLGKPTRIHFLEGEKFVVYELDEKRKITFHSSAEIRDPINKKDGKIYNNVITDVKVFYN